MTHEKNMIRVSEQVPGPAHETSLVLLDRIWQRFSDEQSILKRGGRIVEEVAETNALGRLTFERRADEPLRPTAGVGGAVEHERTERRRAERRRAQRRGPDVDGSQRNRSQRHRSER